MRATLNGIRAILPGWGKFEPENGCYIFHHMPKCGGTALREALDQWFTLINDYISVEQLCGQEPVASPLDLQALGKDSCVCSHFEHHFNHLRVRYPEAFRNRRHYFLFSFVREPLDLAMSLYFHAVKVGRLDPQEHSLQQFIGNQCNYMAHRFPCDKRNYRRVLGLYNFIGLLEEMPLSMEKLAQILGREPVRVPLRNTSPRDQQEAALTAEEIVRFKDRNALDYAIYDHVRTRFFG